MFRTLVLSALWVVLLAACRSVSPPPPTLRPDTPIPAPPTAQPTPTAGVTPESTVNPTAVHLQAKFQIPDPLEGQIPSHTEMGYLVYLPDAYGLEPDRRWPLIFFLHGSGSGEYDSGFVMSYGLPAVLFLGEQPEPFPFIVVSPQAYPNSAWWVDDTLAILNALLDEVVDNFAIDPERVYLTGLSMGGYGSWFLATRYPDRFAAMISISGSGYRSSTLPDDETLCRLADLPVWAIHGELDIISAPSASERAAVGLQERCGGQVKLTMYPDAGHFSAYARAYRDPDLYAWLLDQSR